MRRSIIIALSCLAAWAAHAQMMTDIVNAGPPPAGGCTAATNYLARTSGGNEGGNAANITTLICGLVTDAVITGNLSGATGGCGTHLDVFYVTAQQIQTDANLSLCGTSYSLTGFASLTFTALRGYSGFLTTSTILDSNFNAVSTGHIFAQNSASFGVWTLANGVSNESAAQIGNTSLGTAGESHIYNDFTDNNMYVRLNDASAGGVPSPGDNGFFAGDRSSSTTVFDYYNGVIQVGGVSSTSATPVTQDFRLGGAGSSFSGEQIAAAFVGGTLGSTLQLALYNRLRTYMTAVGVP